MSAIEFEKTNLEAHVELSYERTATLTKKIEQLAVRIDNIDKHLMDIKTSIEANNSGQYKQMLTIGTTVMGILITAVISLLINMILK